MNYYYRDKAGGEIGPLTLDALAKLRFAGVLDGDTPVRAAESAEWKPCREIIAGPPTPIQTQSANATVEKAPFSPVLIILVIAAAVMYGGYTAYKSVAAKTSLAFAFTMDGKALSNLSAPEVKVDGQSFSSGNSIKPGRHLISVRLQNVESFEQHFWVFYGEKNLGALPLESSKGSLMVSVNPSPASVVVRRGVEIVGKGDAPFTLEKLPFGDYNMDIQRGEYKETHPVKIQVKPRTAAKIELNLGSVDLSATPTNADFKLSGNGRQWEGKLPTRLDDVVAGSYKLVVQRGEYEEAHQIDVIRQQRTQTNILLNLGSVDLSATPTNADFKLSGNGRQWEGKLPTRLDDVPVGDYRVLARRGEWELPADISVQRARTSTNKIDFPYGMLEVRSEPPGLSVSTNGVEIGKTPMTLQELIPGLYNVTAEDKDNQLTTSIKVEPRETVKYTFAFHYGALKLESIPTGATIWLGKKELGKTPLMIARIPAGERTLEFQLDGYVSTNLAVRTLEGVTTNYSAKLISEQYFTAIRQARQAFGAAQFSESKKFLTTALESEPNDPAALKLRDEVSQAAAKAEESLRMEQANAKAQALASLPWLDFQKVISDCTDTSRVQHNVLVNDGYYEDYIDNNGKKKQRFHVTGQHSELQTTTESIFNPNKFSERYVGRTFRFNSPDNWSVSSIQKDGVMILKSGGLVGDEIRAAPPASNQDVLKSLQKGQKVIFKAVLKKYQVRFFSRALYLEDAEIIDK